MNTNDKNKGLSISKIMKKKHSSETQSHRNDENTSIRKSNKLKRNNATNINQKKQIFYEDKPTTLYSDEVDISKYIAVFFRFKYLIFSIFILSTLIGLIMSKKITLLYKTSTTILVKDQPYEIELINDKPVLKQNITTKTWQNIITSSPVANIAAKILKNKLTSSEILSMIQVRTSSDKNEKNIISISATSNNPRLASEVANAMYDALVEYENMQRKNELQKAINFLTKEIKNKQDTLSAIEKKINKIIFNNNDKNFLLFKNDIGSININQLNKFQEDLSLAKINLLVVEAKIKELKRKLKEEDNNIISQMTYSEPLKIKLMNLEVDLARALTKYTEKHPKVIEIKKNIENLKKMINKNTEEKIEFKNLSVNPIHQNIINKIIENETEKISLEQKIKALNKILSSGKAKKGSNKLQKLNTQRQTLILLLSDLQKKMNELSVKKSLEINKFEQLNKAGIPKTPINSKKKATIILVSIVLGIILSFLVAILIDTLDDRIFSIKQLNEKINLTLLGSIPKLKNSPLSQLSNLHGENNDINVLETIFKDIYINFKYLIVDDNYNVIAITSSSKGEGKTIVSLMLSYLLQKEYTKILLIDTDFFIPKLSKIFGYEKEKGLSELISNQANISEVKHQIKDLNFDFIPAGKKPPNLQKFFSSKNFITYLNKFRYNYDFVILDTAPLLLIPECNNIFERVNGTILVAKILDTTYTNLKKSIKRLNIIGTDIMGLIINFSRGVIIDKEYESYSRYYYKKYYKGYSKDEEHSDETKKKKNTDKKNIAKEILKFIKNLIILDEDEEIDIDETKEKTKKWKNSRKNKK